MPLIVAEDQCQKLENETAQRFLKLKAELTNSHK